MRYLTTALLLLFWLPLATATPPFPHAGSNLPADPAITWGTLDNGLRYAIMPHAEPPERVSLRLLVQAGSLQETEDQRGLAHFLEHMAFNGSTHYPPGELIDYLQRIGMSFGADTNAHTSFDETVYKLELPRNSEDYLREGLQVMRDYAGELLLRDEEIERERGVILSELRSRDTVSYRAYVAHWEFLLGQTLLPQRFPIGLEEVIRNADRDDFVDYYRTWYRPERIALVVVGEVTPETMIPLIEEHFADLKAALPAHESLPLGELSNPGLAVHLHYDAEAPVTEVSLLSLRPFTELDDRAQRLRSIQRAATNGILDRRLERLSRADGAVFTEGSAFHWDYLDFFEMSGIELTCPPENWAETLALAEQELRRALEHGFTESELAEAKANLQQSAVQALQTAPTRKSRSLSSAIADSLSEGKVFTSPEQDLALVEAALAALTPEHALAVFRDAWSDPDRFVLVSGNADVADAETALRETFEASQQVPVEPPENAALEAWAYADWGRPGELQREIVLDTIEARQAVFTNEIRFNFKQTDFEANTVHVSVSFGGGRQSLPGYLNGLDWLAAETFVEAGLEAHRWDDVQRLMAGRNVSVNLSIGEAYQTLSGRTTPDDLLTQLQLLAAYTLKPGWRSEALAPAQRRIAERYQELRHTPGGVLSNEVEQLISGGSPRFGYPAQDTIAAWTLDDVQRWLAPQLQHAYLEITVVGDLDYETAREAVAATFGALPQRSDAPAPHNDAHRHAVFPRSLREATLGVKTTIPKAYALVYWPTQDMSDISRVRRLNVLSQVFDDRLRKTVREALGEGYSPYARHLASEFHPGYGYLMGLNIADPEKADEVTALMQQIGQELGQGNVTDDELLRAKEPLEKFLEEYLRSNRYWLSRVLEHSQAYPRQIAWAETIEADYAAITVEEINALASEYLHQAPALQVVIEPEVP